MHLTLFESWHSIARVAIVSAIVYVGIVAALRIAGARALAKMSGYDLIVTVALGSLVATIPITASLSLADGAAALLTFLALQELTRWLQSRSVRVHHLVREQPVLVLWDGELLDDRLHTLGITADEVRAAVRRAGMYALTDAQGVVLENDGDWSVLARGSAQELSALDGLDIPTRLPSGASGDRWRSAARQTGAPRADGPGSAPAPHSAI